MLAAAFIVYGVREEGKRVEKEGLGKGSKEPSASESLVASGGHLVWGPGVDFAGLAARQLASCDFLSQVVGDSAPRGLGRLQVFCKFQHWSHGWEHGLPEKAALPLVTRVSLRGTWVVGAWLPQGTQHLYLSSSWK